MKTRTVLFYKRKAAKNEYGFERCAILQKFGYWNDIVAHCISGAIQSDSLKEVIAGDPIFAKIAVPPTFKYRYYTEDIPYGLAIWSKLAHKIGVATPIMDCMVTLGGGIVRLIAGKMAAASRRGHCGDGF